MLVKICRFGLMILLASAALAFGGERRIAFERDDAVCIAKLDGTLIKKLAEGVLPAVSPDALRVAFTAIEKSGSNSMRHIAVGEIATGHTTVFKDVPSDNSYYPTWSPDGKWIVFRLRSDELWHVGMIKADGTTFNFIRKGAQSEATLYAPCWARDGLSIFCQDVTNVYRVGLDGVVLAKWNIEKIIPNGDMSGDGRIDVSPDGKRLLLSIDMGEEHNRKDWDGPLPALWSFDLTTERAVRLTSKNLFAWDGCWLDQDNVLFLSQPPGEKEASIYRMSTNGKNLKRLIKNARMPSVNTP
jgi:TolB protein